MVVGKLHVLSNAQQFRVAGTPPMVVGKPTLVGAVFCNCHGILPLMAERNNLLL